MYLVKRAKGLIPENLPNILPDTHPRPGEIARPVRLHRCKGNRIPRYLPVIETVQRCSQWYKDDRRYCAYERGPACLDLLALYPQFIKKWQREKDASGARQSAQSACQPSQPPALLPQCQETSNGKEEEERLIVSSEKEEGGWENTQVE